MEAETFWYQLFVLQWFYVLQKKKWCISNILFSFSIIDVHKKNCVLKIKWPKCNFVYASPITRLTHFQFVQNNKRHLNFHCPRHNQSWHTRHEPWQRWRSRVLHGSAVLFRSPSASHDVVSAEESLSRASPHKLLWSKHRLHLPRPETIAPFRSSPCHVPMTCKPRPEPWHARPMRPSTTRNW